MKSLAMDDYLPFSDRDVEDDTLNYGPLTLRTASKVSNIPA